MRKRGGTLLTENLIGFIIAIAVIAAIIYGIIAILQPGYDLREEYAKSQLKIIEEKIAESERTGEEVEHLIISNFGSNELGGTKYFLVSFNENQNNIQYSTDKIEEIGFILKLTFYRENKNEEFCVCYTEPWEIKTEEDSNNEVMFKIIKEGETPYKATITCSICKTTDKTLVPKSYEVIPLDGLNIIKIETNSEKVRFAFEKSSERTSISPENQEDPLEGSFEAGVDGL